MKTVLKLTMAGTVRIKQLRSMGKNIQVGLSVKLDVGMEFKLKEWSSVTMGTQLMGMDVLLIVKESLKVGIVQNGLKMARLIALKFVEMGSQLAKKIVTMARMILKDAKTHVWAFEKDGDVLLGLMIESLFANQFVEMEWLYFKLNVMMGSLLTTKDV